MKRNIVLTLVLAFLPLTVNAANLQDLQVRELSKVAMAKYKTYATASYMNIAYTGASTEAVIVINGTNFITYTPRGTTDLSYAEATYTTLGTLCDVINTNTYYTCTLTGGKRDDSVFGLLAVAVGADADAKANGGYDMLIGSATEVNGQVVATTSNKVRVGITPMSGKGVILKYCVGTGAGVGTFNVYGELAKYYNLSDGVTRNDTTLVSSQVTANATEKTVGNIYGGYWMEFAKDQHVVVSVDGAPTVQVAGDQLQCFWDER